VGHDRTQPNFQLAKVTQKMPVHIVLNRFAGDEKRAHLRHDIRAAFEQAGHVCKIAETDSETDPQTLAHRSIDDGAELVVAAGGDGTINAVASALADGPARLGILPFGTFNFVARRFGISASIKEAVDTIVNGDDRQLPVSLVNGAVFLNNASLGVYAAILAEREKLYRQWGRSRLVAGLSVGKTLLRPPKPLALSLHAHGRVVQRRATMVFVAINPLQLELFGLKGRDCANRGRLAVFVVPDTSRAALAGYAAALATGKFSQFSDVEMLCSDAITVETQTNDMSVVRDGERATMRGPFQFDVKAAAVTLRVPAGG
jgi:diacylglycerol kinase family enzyme